MSDSGRSHWTTITVPILEMPIHKCEVDDVMRSMLYERTIVVREHEGHVEGDLYLMKQFDLKLYRCYVCYQQFGVRA